MDFIRQEGGSWYYYDETWDRSPPYPSKAAAREAFDSYCHHWLNGEQFPLPWEEA